MSNNCKDNIEKVAENARDEKVSELEILRQSFEEKKKLAEQYYDQLIRLKAEFENYRRRVEKEKQNYLSWGKEEIILKQLQLLDVIEQAHKSIQTSTNIDSIMKGIDLIYQEFTRMLKNEGISEIKSSGEKFDPSIHEAIEYIESDKKDGTIIDIIQKGYCYNGKVLRPAKVKVACNKTVINTSSSDGAEDAQELGE